MKSFTLKAYGLPWDVRVLARHPDLKKDVGTCDTEKCEIIIGKKYTDAQQRCILLHEILELVSTANGLDLPEGTIKIFENGLYHIIHDNKLRF